MSRQLFDPGKEDHRTVLSTLHQLQYAFRHPSSIGTATPLSRVAVSRFFGRLIDAAENRLMAKARLLGSHKGPRLEAEPLESDFSAAYNFDAIVSLIREGLLSSDQR